MERRDNSGAVFKVRDKKKETFPDYEGTCTIGGIEYYMNAWLKDGAKGKFMSFSFKPKKLPSEPKPQPAFEDRMADDTIPFAPEFR